MNFFIDVSLLKYYFIKTHRGQRYVVWAPLSGGASEKQKTPIGTQNDPIDAEFRSTQRQGDPADDSPVIYGVRAETSNPYHLVCIERKKRYSVGSFSKVQNISQMHKSQ